MMKLFLTIWIFFFSNQVVWCSGKGGSVGSLSNWIWGIVTSTIPGKGSVDNSPNYAKLFECECSLQQKLNKMSEAMKTMDEEAEAFMLWKPIKFPEASAFSALFVRDIGGYLDAWMDLNESKKLKEGSRVLSQHILWIRNVGSKSATSYFIYRPSFVAELESSSILPHLRYHAEAQETIQKIIEVVEAYPNDQIIFAGLQSGGAIAMLHAWMVVSAVPIIYRNLKEYKGELHQLKVFLFDTDCVLSETYARNFPIPSWDVLRFYSGISSKVSPDNCRFDSMKAIGLSYVYTPRTSEYWFGASSGSNDVDRIKFVDYYDKAMAEFELKEAAENIDNGILDTFDDEASVVASEISMSLDGTETRPGRYSNEHQSQHLRSGLTRKTSQPPAPAKNIDSLIEKGIVLLSESVKLSDIFFRNSKRIYSDQQTSYLRRNVDGCAAAMQRNLIKSLLGKETESPVVEKGIKDVKCSVEKYDVKTKIALIICTLISKDSIQSPILRFRTHLQNEMDQILTEKDISVAVNDWEEISMADYSLTTSESNSNPISQGQAGSRSRQGSYSSNPADDLLFDDRSIITGFQEKSEQWTACLDELFGKSSQLNFINPNGNNNLKDGNSVLENTTQKYPGRSVLTIELPFAAMTDAVCEYNLMTQAKNFYQLYRVSPSMFFSIFSEAIEAHPFPNVCENVLDPPSISRKNSGNAEKIAETLNGFFNSDGSTDINHKNVIVNGLEIQESITNLPSNNPYEIFKPALCGKLAECLAQKVLEKLYDCNSHLTLWAGRRHCPETCLHRPAGLGAQPLHLCSRVLNCGDGIYLGFRGCKLFGSEVPLAQEFSPYAVLSKLNSPAYYSAFHLRNSDGWKQFRFVVYFNEDARNTLINGGASIVPSSSSVRSGFSKTLSIKKVNNHMKQQQHHEDSEEEYDIDIEENYSSGRKNSGYETERKQQRMSGFGIGDEVDQFDDDKYSDDSYHNHEIAVEDDQYNKGDNDVQGNHEGFGVIDFNETDTDQAVAQQITDSGKANFEAADNQQTNMEATLIQSESIKGTKDEALFIIESPITTTFSQQMSADSFEESLIAKNEKKHIKPDQGLNDFEVGSAAESTRIATAIADLPTTKKKKNFKKK
jgi:hypothetical protein